MPSDDLAQHATSATDFYALLGITFETSPTDIRRAYRKTALKYHPDKVGHNALAVEKFHLLQIAYDVLTDPAVKALYDNARAARLQKKRQSELFEGKRRRMKEDLEARESRGVKRGRDVDGEEGEGAEERLEREVRRLAEDGKRRRREREEWLRRQLMAEAEANEGRSPAETEHLPRLHSQPDSTATPHTGVPEIDRTVKVRWPREGAGEHLDKDRLTSVFSHFGPVESAFLLKDKKAKTADKREKKVMATGVIVYASVIGAYAAVEDTKKQLGDEWQIFDSVFWAGNKEPDFLPQVSPSQVGSSPTPPSTPLSTRTAHPSIPTPSSASNDTSTRLAPSSSTNTNGNGLRKVPSFASFSSANLNTPSKNSPFGKGLGPNSPSLEEITMIRLRNAEKRRLEEEIRRGDEEAAAAAGEGAAAEGG